jgi:hypothetical protein
VFGGGDQASNISAGNYRRLEVAGVRNKRKTGAKLLQESIEYCFRGNLIKQVIGFRRDRRALAVFLRQ